MCTIYSVFTTSCEDIFRHSPSFFSIVCVRFHFIYSTVVSSCIRHFFTFILLLMFVCACVETNSFCAYMNVWMDVCDVFPLCCVVRLL